MKKRVCMKLKDFFLLFPNHVYLVNSKKKKGHTCFSPSKIGRKIQSILYATDSIRNRNFLS